jgi:hypothetical protein
MDGAPLLVGELLHALERHARELACVTSHVRAMNAIRIANRRICSSRSIGTSAARGLPFRSMTNSSPRFRSRTLRAWRR